LLFSFILVLLTLSELDAFIMSLESLFVFRYLGPAWRISVGKQM